VSETSTRAERKLPLMEIKKAVREHYAELAKVSQPCCTSSEELSVSDASAPVESVASSASCGSPLSQAHIREGEVVLDLGSGGGIDVFRASKQVGPNGKVVGVDSTPEMIFKARELTEKYHYENVEFRLGEIEHLPVENNSVDLVISNCVINLVPDKGLAFKEIYRTIKPGGRIAISDMVATSKSLKPIDLEEWAACIAGAVTVDEYRTLLEQSGFQNIKYLDENHPINDSCCSMNIPAKSVTWVATKPTG
jgi:arsenite methyltransferase